MKFSSFDPKVPLALLDLEKWVTEMIVKPLKDNDSLDLPMYDKDTTAEIELRMACGPHLSAAQSIAIYNQQYWFRFLTLAQENFPTLLRLFGYADFNRLIAEPSIRKYPADHWAIFSATAHLPRWIEEKYEGEDKPLVLQIAQIDAFYHNSFYAPFVNYFKIPEKLVKFRNELLKESVEYWSEHPFPEIS